MKSALNRIFASKSQNATGDRESIVTVKEESAFVSDGYYQRSRSSRRNFPRNRADRSTNFSRLKTKMYPVFNGNVSRCKICDSKFHWVKDCPHKQLDVNLAEHESDELNKTKKKEILLKLHKQFGHASLDKLLSLLQSAGSVDSETKTILKDICTKCLICHKFKHPKAKPVVAFSHANDFNQMVVMDLHEIDHNFYYLHVIDLFSRLSAAAIIRRKDSKVIVDRFMQKWVGIYGAPEVGVYTDNGGEFN
ncbi:Hypothetical predicted protein [Mytilus galloprovincialis]|uniref:Integrase catalytic domain-containing protein n=1 Tax=Mytilus galloprovincialis TaxID=29158 RepID=A0A8B6FIT0_MYTGA|nr:Hypothetical predicted protein [Mytilus galloprovincialis]